MLASFTNIRNTSIIVHKVEGLLLCASVELKSLVYSLGGRLGDKMECLTCHRLLLRSVNRNNGNA